MVEDRRAVGTAESIETAERLFIEDFDTWGMTGYYLYSKLLRSGVSGHIGTGGFRPRGPYYEVPKVFEPFTVFMELTLGLPDVR
jgi:hypothetical protein